MEAIKAGRSIIVAAENEAEVSLTGTKDCYIAEHLQAVCAFLKANMSYLHHLPISSA
jgi:magnesium chelatase family protein